MVTASLKQYRQSPRKVRLVATLIKGKNVNDALAILKFANKRANAALATLLESAIANAKNNFNLDVNTLAVKEMRVDGGQVMKRMMPRARGSAYQILKRTSNVKLVLAPQEPKKEKKAPLKKSAKKAKAA